MCHIEEKLENRNKMTALYKRYVHKCPMFHYASEFLLTLDEIHPPFNFTTANFFFLDFWLSEIVPD